MSKDTGATRLEDGGPAFPFLPTQDRHGNTPGMSLRDWFAGQALAGITSTFIQTAGAPLAEIVAQDAYALADAMLLKRAESERSS